jgi:hypothetical protein
VDRVAVDPDSTRVIVVNFNAGDALQHCVASVLASQEPLRLVVADNDSSDGSCQRLRARYAGNPRMEILENPVNLGFARAVNALALSATENWLLILNPDCELYPGALRALRQALEHDAAAAIAGPRVVDRQGRVLRGTLRSFPDPWKALMTGSGLCRLGRRWPVFCGVEAPPDAVPEHVSRAEAVSGACMLVRRVDFQSVGGFDEAYAMHFEDLDLMARLRQQERFCLYVPQACVYHQVGVSSRSRPWWVHRQKHLGMLRFFQQHQRARLAAPLRWLTVLSIGAHYLLTLPQVWWRR